MNIKRFINQNQKLIWYTVIIIIFVLFAIKTLNFYYEEEEKNLKNEIEEDTIYNQISETQDGVEDVYNVENDSIEKTMSSFVKYCNKGEIENAYKMLTDECKNAMYKTIEDFENDYIKKVFNEQKEYSMANWASDGDIKTYKIEFIGNLLATGGKSNITEEFYTFIKTGDIYKININNYINGKSLDKEIQKSGICIKIKNINTYNTYEEYEISITNNTSKEICLTGNKYRKNIYLKNSTGTTYSSLNSVFDNNEITLKPDNTKNYTVKFNKNYNPQNKVNSLVLSDIIWDYEEYVNTENKNDYSNRTSIELSI